MIAVLVEAGVNQSVLGVGIQAVLMMSIMVGPPAMLPGGGVKMPSISDPSVHLV